MWLHVQWSSTACRGLHLRRLHSAVVAKSQLYPGLLRLQDIRTLSAEMAAAVIKAAAAEGHVGEEAEKQVAAGHDQLLCWIRNHMFVPAYSR